MKKILFAAVALVAMASCATEDVVSRPDNNVAIEFDNLFVENVTRATDLTAGNLVDFGVYGSVEKGSDHGMIFTNQEVAKNNQGKFVYSPAQYWVGGATYSFTAFAPRTNQQWAYATSDAKNGTISFNNAAALGEQDFLFAAAERTTVDPITSAPEAVALNFNHMLSRVMFSFTNGTVAENNLTFAISNIEVINAHANGTLAVANGVVGNWEVTEDVFTRAFGDVATLAAEATGRTPHYYFIPADDTITVEFDVTLYMAGVNLGTYNRSATIDLNLEMGVSYNICANINADTALDEPLYPIEFKVESVDTWDEFQNEAAVVSTPVATAAELAEAVALGGNIVLTQDIDLDQLPTTLASERYAGLTISKNTVIDGAGFTVSSSAIRAINVAGDANLDVTIKNLVVEAEGERAINVELCKSVTLNNVTASATHYALNLVGAADNVTVVANNCDFSGLNVINVWGENANVTLNDTVLNLEDNATPEAYGAIQINGDAVNSVVTVNGGEVVITGSANDSFGGVVIASGASIIFNGTEGTTTIMGQPFVINYANGYTYSFSTLAEAVEVAVAGDTIVLTQDATVETAVSVDKNITIDLNGKTLTVLESNFVNNATLVISNGTISGANTQAGRRAIVNKGNLTMTDVTVAQVYAGGGSAINNDGATAVAVLNNVTVNAENMAISNKNGATMTINGGNFVGNGKGGSYAVVNQIGSTMTINGGYFEGGHGVVSSTEGSTTTLNGGTYNCTCTYTGNSDWVLYTSYASSSENEHGTISYNEDNCTFNTARADGMIYYSACASYITAF